MSKKEKKAKGTALQEDIKLDIPEDEIWTYQIPGLAAPHINKPYKHYGLKKIIFAIVIIIAVSLSMYFSVRTVYNETFEYTELESGYQFDKFSNSGYITELDIDYVSTIEYDDDNKDPMTNFTIVKDEAKKVTEIREYALNCDGTVKVVNIGADVEKIDGKSFYSCWALQRIEVDENNPYYCDVDGVLYNKDKTEIICVPCDRDQYLRDKYGYAEVVAVEDAKYAQYEKDVLTYVIPSTVEKVGKLCFNYANLTTVYIPEGVKTIETLGFYEIPMLKNVYSYVAENEITDTRYTSNEALGKVYRSLPEGLEYIGSDAFTECRALSYVYIPSSVNYIGHHAFWDTVSKDGDTFNGVSAINVAMDEESFKDVHTGDEWSPRYLVLIFTKSVDINYSAEREPMEIVEPDQKPDVKPDDTPDVKPDDTPDAEPDVKPDVDGDVVVYTVAEGDTLWSIAEKYLGDGARYHEIVAFNNLDSDDVDVGQKLNISIKDYKIYIVDEGDSLWTIAEEYYGDGTRYKDIVEFNGLTSKDLWHGQKLTIPE